MTNQPSAATNHHNLREDFKNLTPEQRRAKIQELRQMHGVSTNLPVSLTLEERRARIKKRIEELEQKKKLGTITPLERRQLELMQPATNRPVPLLKQAAPIKAAPGQPAGTNFQFLSK